MSDSIGTCPLPSCIGFLLSTILYELLQRYSAINRPSLKLCLKNDNEKTKRLALVKSAILKRLGDFFDHTALKPETTVKQIETLCDEAITNQFASVCVNSVHVPRVVEYFNTNGPTYNSVRVCAVVGFPLGAMASSSKVHAP
jgi:hypothetical protein